MIYRKIILILVSCLFFSSSLFGAESYDLVISNGRVIDPETGLDAVRNIGVSRGKITMISSNPLTGKKQIEAKGLVVSPGFIDLHAHGQNVPSQTYQVRDGVTTALELEIGHQPFDDLEKRRGKALINYGYSASHWQSRFQAKANDPKKAYHEEATEDELQKILQLIEADLKKGAIGIGVGLDYMSLGVNDRELEALFRLAKKFDRTIFIHIRMPDDVKDLTGFQELIDMTRKTGASFHMVHLVSTGLSRVPQFIKMLDAARAEGLDITTELYPYTAGSTMIGTGMFDHDWQKKLGVSYDAVEWTETGERFKDKAMWDDYRARFPEKVIIIHAFKEDWIEQGLRHDGIMVASDGMMLKNLHQRAHPRSMGTFSRILGRYVRERKVIDLATALKKMTYLPAKRLEHMIPEMAKKGRLKLGADADLTIFDPARVIDRATYLEPNQFSKGIIHVIVAGEQVVRDEKLVDHIFPGQPIKATN